MCGIAGIYRFDKRPVDQAILARMRASTSHRGPDDEGLWASAHVGLVHNRLSILDLSPNGHQPMYEEVGKNWIAFNGEIYNFREIRADLEKLGHEFRTSCDTEVILHAYREWGVECLRHFRGMFGFALYDTQKDQLFVVRDRMGIKPVYYYQDSKQFVFGSETKAVIQADDVPRRINRAALPEFIAFRYVCNGQTLFEGIRELSPGHYMIVNARGVITRQDRDIPFGDDPDAGDDGRDWLGGFEEILHQAVKYRLIADVPVGCALSGGVDSSLVTGIACEVATSTMKTFSIGFPMVNSDERPYAKKVSAALGVLNFDMVLEEDEFYNRLSKLTWHMDEPINHPNSVGIWLLSKLARPKVTVLLSGEGGDELLGGYSRFRSVLKYRKLPPGARTIAQLLPSGVFGKKARVIRELRRDLDGATIWSSAFLGSHHLQRLFGPACIELAEGERRRVLAKAPTNNVINRHLYLEQKTYLASLLVRNDKMTMAEGLENRVPLIDHHLVEYACKMPTRYKYSTERGKIALFDLVERRFGKELFNRPKVGFTLPVSYFKGKGLARLKDLINSKSFRDRELMDPRGLKDLLDRHESSRENLAEAVWSFAALELWARTFIDKPGVMVS